MIRAVIVDDEEDALITIGSFVGKFCPEITNTSTANSVRTAIDTIDRERPHLVFLDINMQDGTGFDVLNGVVHKDFETIFTTAYDEFAIKAFKVKALDYLLKPINPLELKNAVVRASDLIGGRLELDELKKTIEKFKIEKVGLPLKDKITLTKINDIVRLQAEANYTYVYLQDKTRVLVAKTLKTFEELLSEKSFIRVHQSHIVNLSMVESFDQKASNLILASEDEIPVSRRYKSSLISLLSMRIV